MGGILFFGIPADDELFAFKIWLNVQENMLPDKLAESFVRRKLRANYSFLIHIFVSYYLWIRLYHQPSFVHVITPIIVFLKCLFEE